MQRFEMGLQNVVLRPRMIRMIPCHSKATGAIPQPHAGQRLGKRCWFCERFGMGGMHPFHLFRAGPSHSTSPFGDPPPFFPRGTTELAAWKTYRRDGLLFTLVPPEGQCHGVSQRRIHTQSSTYRSENRCAHPAIRPGSFLIAEMAWIDWSPFPQTRIALRLVAYPSMLAQMLVPLRIPRATPAAPMPRRKCRHPDEAGEGRICTGRLVRSLPCLKSPQDPFWVGAWCFKRGSGETIAPSALFTG